MNKAEKQQVVDEIEAKLKTAATAVITDYRGLNVQELAVLREQLREQGVEYKVYKNTLAKKAVDNMKLEGLEEFLSGPTAIAFSDQDPVVPAKLLAAYAKKNNLLKIKGGLLEGKILGLDEMKAVAGLPAREVLLAQLVGMLQAPLSGLVNVLSGPPRGLAVALGQIANSKGE